MTLSVVELAHSQDSIISLLQVCRVETARSRQKVLQLNVSFVTNFRFFSSLGPDSKKS